MKTFPEHAGALNGVPGRFYPAHSWDAARWSSQTWISEARAANGYGCAAMLQVEARFDDNCKNGHNTFAITGTIRRKDRRGPDDGWLAGGCLHEDIARVFPELAPLIQWHLCSSDGPMHYIANTVYLAGDRDSRGLRKGEKRQLVNGRTKEPVWSLRADATGCALKTALGEDEDIANLPIYRLQDMLAAPTMPEHAPRLFWEPCWIVGEGKARELDKARAAAIWPEATDAELCAEPDVLRATLAARLPDLLAAFREDITRAGFIWEPGHE